MEPLNRNTRGIKATSAIIITVIAGFFCWGISGLNHHLIVAIDKFGDAAAAGKVAASGAQGDASKIVTEIIRPCSGDRSDPNTCGLLADLKSVAIDTRHAVITTQLQVKQTDTLIRSAADAINSTSNAANQTLYESKGTLHAATGTLDALTQDENAIRPAIERVPAIEDAAKASLDRFNTLLQRPAIETLEDNAAKMSVSSASIFDTADKVTKKASHGYLNPSRNPWVRTGNALQPYAPLGVKTALCYLVPSSCL